MMGVHSGAPKKHRKKPTKSIARALTVQHLPDLSRQFIKPKGFFNVIQPFCQIPSAGSSPGIVPDKKGTIKSDKKGTDLFIG
jgi:hypothetical protein